MSIKITDVTDSEVRGVFDSDERLDTLTLRETDTITKVTFVKSIVEGIDKNGNRFLTFTLQDKRGLSISGKLFNINNEVALEEYLQLNNKIVIVEGVVDVHRNSYSIHVTSLTPVDNTGYKREDFVRKNDRIDELVTRLDTILKICSQEEYLVDTIKHIKKLGIAENFKKADLVGYNSSRVGDMLECVVLVCEELLRRKLVTETGVNISKVGCIFIILREGLNSFIKTQVDKGEKLISTTHTTTIVLVNNLMKSYNLFMNKGIEESLKLEFLHYNEACMEVVEPQTFLARYLIESFKSVKKSQTLVNILSDSSRGNKYNIDGFEINRIL